MTVSEMMSLVNIHELLGAGMRAARLRLGWRQQDASKEYQRGGLPNWTPDAVQQVETGVRKPSIGDLLLAAATLRCSLADLVPDVDERIDVGTGASMTSEAVRALLSGGDIKHLPMHALDTPGDAQWREFMRRAQAEHDRLMPLLEPILARSAEMTGHDEIAALSLPTEAESRAADRLGRHPVEIKGAARVLWRRDFEEERDARASEPGVSPGPGTMKGRRGHATRAMLEELRAFLEVDGEAANVTESS